MGSKLKRVPWCDWQEWSDVIDRLLQWENSPEEARRALDRVGAWRARSVLSIAVDGIASLVAVLLMPPSETTRLAMGLALTRVVNALTEKEQAGRVAAPLSVLGAALGLPEGLVELRHDSTHNAMPTMAALRTAAKQCLSFLCGTYVVPQYEMSRNASAYPHPADGQASARSLLILETGRLEMAHKQGDIRAEEDAADVLLDTLGKFDVTAARALPLWSLIKQLLPLHKTRHVGRVLEQCKTLLHLPERKLTLLNEVMEAIEPEFFEEVVESSANFSETTQVQSPEEHDDAERSMEALVKSKKRKRTAPCVNPWTLCPISDWEGVPLGLLPGSRTIPPLTVSDGEGFDSDPGAPEGFAQRQPTRRKSERLPPKTVADISHRIVESLQKL